MKKYLIIMGVVGALAVGIFAIAVAGAQEGSPTPAPSAGDDEGEEERERPLDRFLDRLAENLGISRDELDSTIDETQIELIDEAVAEGRLDEEKAEELKERIENGEPLFPFAGPRPHHPPVFPGIRWILDAAAEILGLEHDELLEQMGDGNSLAEIAEAQGIDVEQLKADLLAAVKEDLDAKVADGELTQERADKIYERFSENIDRIVNFERELSLEFSEDGAQEGFHFSIGPNGEGAESMFEALPGLEGEASPLFGPGVPAPFGDFAPWFPDEEPAEETEEAESDA
jgi:uncharacterized protein YidB (DUF937 family)